MEENQINKDFLKGFTDLVVLSILSKKDHYGFEIFLYITKKSESEFFINEATLYSAYKRLEKNGQVESYWGDETLGGRRKYYRITKEGRESFKKLLEEYDNTIKLINKLIKK